MRPLLIKSSKIGAAGRRMSSGPRTALPTLSQPSTDYWAEGRRESWSEATEEVRDTPHEPVHVISAVWTRSRFPGHAI